MITFVKNNSLLTSNKYRRTIVEYISDVSPTGGSTGANDPTTYGWTYFGAGSAYSDAYDSGDGGWRIVDGTISNPSTYYQAFSGTQAQDLLNKNWQANFLIAVDKDAIQANGTTVSNYYLAPNNSRQNTWGIVVRVSNTFNYWVNISLDSSNQVQLRNWYNVAELYNTGHYIGGANPFPEFLNCYLKYNKSSSQASVYINDTFLGNITSGTTTANDEIFFGSPSVNGQGSAIWNSLKLEVY